MHALINLLARSGALKGDLDRHLVRASMVLVFLFFGYQKWFAYEAQTLIPFISHGPLIAWMYPVFGVRGASTFLGVSEWAIAALLFAGFWNKTAGAIDAIGGVASMVAVLLAVSVYLLKQDAARVAASS